MQYRQDPLSNSFKIKVKEGVPGHTLTPIFTIVALKIWAYSTQNGQNW